MIVLFIILLLFDHSTCAVTIITSTLLSILYSLLIIVYVLVVLYSSDLDLFKKKTRNHYFRSIRMLLTCFVSHSHSYAHWKQANYLSNQYRSMNIANEANEWTNRTLVIIFKNQLQWTEEETVFLSLTHSYKLFA